MREEWRPCYGGYYEASSLGRVRRAKGWTRRMPRGGTAALEPDGQPLKAYYRKRDGRYYVSVCIEGKRYTRGVHQLVADAFLGPRPDGLEVNHINGDPTDNRASNLEYVTRAENCAHAARLGLTKAPPVMAGERNPNAKLAEVDVREMRRRYRKGACRKTLADAFGVCTSTVDYVVRRVYWRHVA